QLLQHHRREGDLGRAASVHRDHCRAGCGLMAGKSTLRIDGLKELDKALGDLPKATARNVLHRTLRKAGAPIAEEASRLAPDDPATQAPDLHTSIAVSTRLKNKAGDAEYA